MHINDWAAIQTLFDKLNKQVERTQKVRGGAEGDALGGVSPRFCRQSGLDAWPCPIRPHRLPVQVTQSLGVPRAYVRMLCELEDFMAKTLAGALGGRRCTAYVSGEFACCAYVCCYRSALAVPGWQDARVLVKLLCPPPTTLTASSACPYAVAVLPCPPAFSARRKAQAEPHQHTGAHPHEADAAQAQHCLRRADAYFQVWSPWQ